MAYIWIGILTATTYVFAGWMREQVCVYMSGSSLLVILNALRAHRGAREFG